MPRSTWIDYATVKDRVTIDQVLEARGHPFRKKADGSLESACPIHGGHDLRHFRASANGRGYHCFSCDAGGNVIDLVVDLEGLAFRDAAIRLARDFKIGEALKRPN